MESISIDNPLADPSEEITLTPDQHAVLLRELSDQIMGYSTLHQMAKAGEALPRGLTRSILYLGEAHNAELCKLTGIETDGSRERDERFVRVRELNARNRELEQQLGSSGSPLQTAAHLKVLAEKLNTWWDREGFGYISTLNFNQNGALEAEFSCHLMGDFRIIGSDTPVSDKTNRDLWHESLAKKGFLLESVRGDRDPVVPDCDINRQTLATLFSKTFPSSEIVETKSLRVPGASGGKMALRSVNLYIRDLAEVDALPLKSASTPAPSAINKKL